MTQMIRFFLNGHWGDVQVRPDTTVLEWLRGEARLKGTKEGCAEGGCGACSVLIGTENTAITQADTANKHIQSEQTDGAIGYRAVNSCILSMGQIDGKALVTVEGLKTTQLHPVQAAMAENGSSQCGFCTPGIVMSLSGLASECKQDGLPADDQRIHDTLAGNLCRCTGYRPIVEAARKVIAEGAAVAEVAVDTLTGETRCLRADILQDNGFPLNPAIDLGQIEGSFVQGMGWVTCEELWWDKAGRLRTAGPSTYKTPGSRDVPEIFNVGILENAPNREDTVFRSKAIGGPPLMQSLPLPIISFYHNLMHRQHRKQC